MSDIKYRLGRKALLEAVRDARPVRLEMAGAFLEVYLCYESHRLPGRFKDWSDIDEGNVRLWLVCLGCRRRFRKLYCYSVSDGVRQMSDIRCRRCHGLCYQSQNCSRNKWWRQVRNMKRLLRERRRILLRRPSQRATQRLRQIDELLTILQLRATGKSRASKCAGARLRSGRRRYRDWRLALSGI